VQPLLQWKSNKCYKFRECIGSLIYQACKANASFILSLMAVWLCNIYPHYLIKGTTFGKKILGHKMYVFIFPTILSKAFLIIRITERDIINLCWYSSNVTVITVRFEWMSNCLERVSKNSQLSVSMKIRPVGAEFFHSHGRMEKHTDRQTWQS